MPDTPTGAADAAPERAPAPDLPPQAEAVQRAIAAWVDERLRDSPLSRVTDAWNHLWAELPVLQSKILKEIAHG